MSVFWCPVPGCVSGCIYKCSECVGMTLSDQIGHRTPGSYIILTLATTTSTIRYTLRPRNMQIHTTETLEIIKRAIFRTKVIVMCNVSVMQRNVLPHSLIIKPRVFTSPGALGVCSSGASRGNVIVKHLERERERTSYTMSAVKWALQCCRDKCYAVVDLWPRSATLNQTIAANFGTTWTKAILQIDLLFWNVLKIFQNERTEKDERSKVL